MLQTYKAYYEGGQIIPRDNPFIPEGSELIITIMDTPIISKAKRQRETFQRFISAMDNAPPLPDEFDKILAQRVNITREMEL